MDSAEFDTPGPTSTNLADGHRSPDARVPEIGFGSGRIDGRQAARREVVIVRGRETLLRTDSLPEALRLHPAENTLNFLGRSLQEPSLVEWAEGIARRLFPLDSPARVPFPDELEKVYLVVMTDLLD